MSNFCKFDYFNGLSFNIVQILDRLSEQIFRIVFVRFVCVYRSFVFRSNFADKYFFEYSIIKCCVDIDNLLTLPVAIFVYKQCLFMSVTWSGEACIHFVLYQKIQNVPVVYYRHKVSWQFLRLELSWWYQKEIHCFRDMRGLKGSNV
jgi:hypothetical protein